MSVEDGGNILKVQGIELPDHMQEFFKRELRNKNYYLARLNLLNNMPQEAADRFSADELVSLADPRVGYAPGAIEAMIDERTGKSVGDVEFSLSWHGPFLVVRITPPEGESHVNWHSHDRIFHELEYRDDLRPDWMRISAEKLPGYGHLDGEGLLVPPQATSAEVRIRRIVDFWGKKEGTWTIETIQRPPNPGFDATLLACWERDNYEAFGNHVVNVPNVNGTDENGDTLGHIIARSDHYSRYAYLGSLLGECWDGVPAIRYEGGGLDCNIRNNAGKRILDIWRANKAEMGLVGAHEEIEKSLENLPEAWLAFPAAITPDPHNPPKTGKTSEKKGTQSAPAGTSPAPEGYGPREESLKNRDRIIAEIDAHIEFFLGRRHRKAVARWRSLQLALLGRPGGTTVSELEQWLVQARKYGWKRGLMTLPSALAILREAENE